jgi:hypothetical protein
MIPKFIIDKRKGIMGLLIWSSIIMLVVAGLAIHEGKWSEAVSCLGVFAALVSAMFAFEVIHQGSLNQLPQIIVKIDGESRYSLLQLVVKNIGGSTAYRIKLSWIEEYGPTKKRYGKPQSIFGGFVQIHKNPDFDFIVSLQKDESHFVIIDGYNAFYKKNPYPTDYILRVEFFDQLESGNKFDYIIPISMEAGRLTLDHAKESTKAYYSLTKIPEKLEKMTDELRKIQQVLTTTKGDTQK